MMLLCKQKEVITFEHEDVRADGSPCWLSWTCHAFFDERGEVSQIQAVGSDVTARKNGELALKALNERLQKILNTMNEGLLVVDLEGHLAPVSSAAVEKWFGRVPPKSMIWDYLFGTEDENDRLQYQLAFEQLAEGFLPIEVLLDQLPKHLTLANRHYQLRYQPVMDGDRFSEMLITVIDVTVQLLQEKTEKRLRELPAVIGNLMRDRSGFTSFVEETEQLFTNLAQSSDPEEQHRVLHTLKGNTAVYGFLHFAERCHALEGRLAEEERELNQRDISELEQEWREAFEQINVFLGNESGTTVRLERSEYEDILSRIETHEDYTLLLNIARSWAHPSLGRILQVHEKAIERLASRLGKKVAVEVETNNMRLPDARIRPFIATLAHVVRNTVDHGSSGRRSGVRSVSPRPGRSRSPHIATRT